MSMGEIFGTLSERNQGFFTALSMTTSMYDGVTNKDELIKKLENKRMAINPHGKASEWIIGYNSFIDDEITYINNNIKNY